LSCDSKIETHILHNNSHHRCPYQLKVSASNCA
jgi:hypothetical protein